MNIRQVEIIDAEQIAEIYNFYVQNTHHTFETEPVNFGEMQKRIGEIIKNYPYIIAEENDEILAYAYAAKYKSRCAYQKIGRDFGLCEKRHERKRLRHKTL
ncbi:MAG: GNAT family N-acetyltransferase [Pyrinomonadaceae bacterium]